MDENQATAMAQATAKMAGQIILAAPTIIRLEAAFMLVRAIILSDVKPGHQLELYEEYVEKIRNAIVDDLNKDQRNVTPDQSGNERSHRRPGARNAKKKKR